MDLMNSPALLILSEKSDTSWLMAVPLLSAFTCSFFLFCLEILGSSCLAASQGVLLSFGLYYCRLCDSELAFSGLRVPSATEPSSHATFATSLWYLLLF